MLVHLGRLLVAHDDGVRRARLDGVREGGEGEVVGARLVRLVAVGDVVAEGVVVDAACCHMSLAFRGV